MSMAYPSEFKHALSQPCMVVEVLVQPSTLATASVCDQEPKAASSLDIMGNSVVPSMSCNDRLRSFGI